MKSPTVATLFVGRQGLRAGWGLLLFTLTLVVLAACLFFILPRGLPAELDLFLSETMLCAAVAGSTAVMAGVEGRGVLSYGLSDPHAVARFLQGAFWAVVLLTLVIGGLLASGHVAVERGDLAASDALSYGLAYAAGLIVVAAAEEMLFRGYLQVTLARLVGFWPAACVLSLAFGLVHRGNAGESALGLLSAVLIGGVFCLALRLSGSLWWNIGFHAAWDWAQSFLWGTPVSGFVLPGRLMRSHALGDAFWSGGATGPEGSLLILPIVGLAALVVLRSFRRTGT